MNAEPDRSNQGQPAAADARPEAGQPPPSGDAPRTVREWLKRAFAVDAGPREPTSEEKAVVETVLKAVVKRGLATPALLFLESSRPLNYLGAQAMHFMAPFAEVVLPEGGYRLFTQFLERRGSIDYLCRRLQELDEERRGGEQNRPSAK